MKIDMKKFVPAVLMTFFFAGVIVSVLPYPMAAKRLPLAVSLLGIILSLMVIWEAMRPSRQPEKGEEAPLAEEDVHAKVAGDALMKALAWVVGVLVAVYLLGLQVGLAFYAFLYCKLHGGGWLGSVVLGLGIMIFIYLIFVLLLNTIFPAGLLFELFV